MGTWGRYGQMIWDVWKMTALAAAVADADAHVDSVENTYCTKQGK